MIVTGPPRTIVLKEKGRPWRTTWAVEEDELQGQDDDEEPEDGGAEESQEDEPEHDDDILACVDVGELTQEQAESFAVVMQMRKHNHKGRGKGGKSRTQQG